MENVMTYDEVIFKFPWFDFAFELFKGIVPTIVALTAILINNLRAKKRDKINKEKEIIISIQNNMLNKFIEISQLYWNSGTILINFLSENENENRNKLKNDYGCSLNNFLFKAQEISDYYNTMFKCFNIKVNCSDIVKVSKEFSDSLNNIAEEFYDTYIVEEGKVKENKLNQAAKKVLEATGEVKAWNNITMVQIAENIRNKVKK